MFDTLERSRFGGKPRHLFIFQRGMLLWRFCNGSVDIELGGETYTATHIARSALRDSTESLKNNITITFPYLLDPDADEFPPTQALGNNWRPYPPSDRVYVHCLSMHQGDDAAITEWTGRVVSPKVNGTTMELTCEPTRSSGRRTGMQKRWQRACWKPLYSQGLGMCNLDPEPLAVPGTLTVVAGNDITAEGFADPPRVLVGGAVQWVDDEEATHIAEILAHTGTTLTLDDATGLAVDAEVVAYTVPLWVPATLTAVDGLALTSPDFATAPRPLAGGYFKWTREDGLQDYRTIMSHSGDTIVVNYGASDFAVDLEGRAYHGCAHNWAACASFGNQDNYGGGPYKPVKNPMSGMPVW